MEHGEESDDPPIVVLCCGKERWLLHDDDIDDSLTLSFGKPDKENICIVNDSNNGRNEDNKDVADDDLWTYG